MKAKRYSLWFQHDVRLVLLSCSIFYASKNWKAL